VDESERASRVADGLAHFAGARAPDAIVTARDLEVVIVARERGGQPGARLPGPAQLAAACLAHARQRFPAAVLTVAIGGACREPAEIARAYAQARRTVGTLRRLGRHGQVVAFEDLGIHRLLLQVPDLDELRSFVQEVVGPLLAGDRSSLLRTLAVYLRENGSLQRAARELHVHPNTVTYRLDRVAGITGLDLGRYQDRLSAQVALEILEALGGG
jgi:DNA-binding PucR family transcriptional regulator